MAHSRSGGSKNVGRAARREVSTGFIFRLRKWRFWVWAEILRESLTRQSDRKVEVNGGRRSGAAEDAEDHLSYFSPAENIDTYHPCGG